MKLEAFSLMTGTAVLALTVMHPQAANGGPKPKQPKDILHLHLKKEMTNTGVIAGASGQVDIHVDLDNKNKNKQDVHIKLTGLETNTTYQVAALLKDDTNLTQVTEFTTKEDGNASLHFKDDGKAAGKEKHPLPAALNPVGNIHEVQVLNGSGAVVLSADVTSPYKFVYLVERDLSAETNKVSLHIHVNQQKGKLDLHASGLSPANDYSLALNGAVVKTQTSDAKGKVKFKQELASPVEILNLGSVALLDSTGGIVVSTTLP